MVDRVFSRCAERLVEKLQPDAINGTAVNMEDKFSQLTLDVIGLSVFNYNFDALNSDSPVIEAVYTSLKEAEARSTDLLPYWKESSFLITRFLIWSLDFLCVCQFSCLFISRSLLLQVGFLCKIIPRQIKAEKAVSVIRETVEDLIAKCKEIVESEGERIDADEYVNDADPSILRFLLASREEVCCISIASV